MKNLIGDNNCVSEENLDCGSALCEDICSEKISMENNAGICAEGGNEESTVEANCEIADEDEVQQGLTKAVQDSPKKNTGESDEESCLITKGGRTRIIDSDDENHEDHEDNIRESCQNIETKTKFGTSKKKSKNQIKEERLKIHSETHRFMRERNITIPYHLPKQRTLKEFLSRKKNRANIPLNTPSFKMVEIWKDIEESTKTASEFFRSDSDSDSEESRKKTKDKKHKQKSQDGEDKCVSCDDTHNEENADRTENSAHCNSSSDKQDNCSNNNDNTSENSQPAHKPLTVEENNSEKENEDNTIAADSQEETAEVVPCKFFDEGTNQKCNLGEAFESSNSNQLDADTIQNVEESNSCDSYTKMKTLEWVKNIPVPGENLVRPNKKEILLKKINPTLLKITPKLSGESDSVIDLENDKNEIEIGAKKLKSRFFKNCLPPRQPVKNEVQMTLTVSESNEKGEISNVSTEKLIYHPTETFDVKCEKPGAKLQRLREELQRKIEEKWEEEYKRQKEEAQLQACHKAEDMIEDEELLEDLEDGNLTESLDSESEDEDESDDEEDEHIDDDEPERKKENMFIDSEAEESGNEGGDELVEDEDEEKDEDEEDEDEDKDEDEVEEEFEDDNDNDNDSVTLTAKENSAVQGNTAAEIEEIHDKDSNDAHAYDTQSSQIPPYQPGGGMLNGGSELSQCDDDNSFPKNILSPTLKLSMDLLPGKGAASQQSWDLDLELPQLNGSKTNFVPRFSQNENFDLSDAYEFCSGKFPDNPEKSQGARMDSQGSVTSGSNEFGFNSGVISTKNTSSENENSREDVEVSRREKNTVSRLKVESDDSEEETEFQDTQANELEDITGERISSDDSDNEEEKSHVVKNKKTRKQLHFSDEEENSGSEEEEEEEDASDSKDEPQEEENADGRDDFSESEVDPFEEESDRKVEYNSEEEEIINPREFFEKEAELSGSEWSGDEDERDLDKMEEEEGDDDKLDSKKVRSQLEKIHMRTLLDDDARQVQILQELLFEDGDLFDDGPKREKNFRWKDLGTFFEDDGNGGDASGPQDQEEIEEDEQSTKQRHEKELFLLSLKSKKEESGLDGDEDERLSLVKPGKVVLKTSMKSNIVREEKVVRNNGIVVESVDFKASGVLSTKRGSFLSRNEEFLSRLAKFTLNATDNILGPKHSKNFVFASKSPEKANNSSKENSHPKRKGVSPENVGQTKKKAKLYSEINNQKPSVLDRLV